MQGGADDSWSEIRERIESIDERGRSGGTYCTTRDDQSIFAFELRPKCEVKSKVGIVVAGVHVVHLKGREQFWRL